MKSGRTSTLEEVSSYSATFRQFQLESHQRQPGFAVRSEVLQHSTFKMNVKLGYVSIGSTKHPDKKNCLNKMNAVARKMTKRR